MNSLVLFLEPRECCESVNSFSDLSDDAECVSLVSCSSLCLLRGRAENYASHAHELVVIGCGTSSLGLGGNGVVFFSRNSESVVKGILRGDMIFEAIVSNIEGVLDDGLNLGEDFSVNSAFSINDLAGLERVFLASSNNELGGYWCYRIFLNNQEAVLHLLRSATMGYLLGVKIECRSVNSCYRLVRCAGYDDSETDLLLFEGDVFLPSGDILAAF